MERVQSITPGTVVKKKLWNRTADGGPVISPPFGDRPHTQYMRMPPFLPGLVLEGEPGDYMGGPVALKRKLADNQHEVVETLKLALDEKSEQLDPLLRAG